MVAETRSQARIAADGCNALGQADEVDLLTEGTANFDRVAADKGKRCDDDSLAVRVRFPDAQPMSTARVSVTGDDWDGRLFISRPQ